MLDKSSDKKRPVLVPAIFVFIILISLLLRVTYAQTDQNDIYSPTIGRSFYEKGYELGNCGEPNRQELEQAVVFYQAARKVDSSANYLLADMIRLLCKDMGKDRSDQVYQLLTKYVDKSADLEVTNTAVNYLLENLSTREKREQMLAKLRKDIGKENDALDSELAVLLGMLKLETADTEGAAKLFMEAYSKNQYNLLAFEKLMQYQPSTISKEMELANLRNAVTKNPLALDKAVGFAEKCKQYGLYQVAADVYKYSSNLFNYLRPDAPLPESIYIPWIVCTYNTQRGHTQCLKTAEQIRSDGEFNTIVEVIAARAARAIGNNELALETLDTAERKIKKLAQEDKISPEQVSWFYLFGEEDANNALDWANKAYAQDPNNPTAAGMLAYSLVLNGQIKWAEPILDKNQQTPVSKLAQAQLYLNRDDTEAAKEILKEAISLAPASLEAEKAKKLLGKIGGEYIESEQPEMMRKALASQSGENIIPPFVPIEKALSIEFNTKGMKFAYGNDFEGSLIITNTSRQKILVGKSSLLKGYIRIDAKLTGDIEREFPGLVSRRVRPSQPIQPNRSLVIPLKLKKGKLKNLLESHPQAKVEIHLTGYIDPVQTSEGKIVNNLEGLKPAEAKISRGKIQLTTGYLQNRLNALGKERPKSGELFIGLLKEEQLIANEEPPYRLMYADWMPELLKSAIEQTLTQDGWVVKVRTLLQMENLELDYRLTEAAGDCLNSEHWPTRLSAVYLLAKSQTGFDKVLEHIANYDSSKPVRDMALATGAKVNKD